MIWKRYYLLFMEWKLIYTWIKVCRPLSTAIIVLESAWHIKILVQLFKIL